jgi:hypothetical protein
MRRGINVDPIFPAAPEDKARLRFFVTSCHSPERIRFMVEVLAEELALLSACGTQDFHKHSPSGLPDRDFGKARLERRL